ncbi:MAG: hypothetical protein CSB13_01950 [Chloroflexi bacterium]|nr:MAG: hypothetical protein CSB13_01950 [Chloroflexota bacterium]
MRGKRKIMSRNSSELLIEPLIKRSAFLAGMLVMIFMYWAFAHFIENINLLDTLNAVWHAQFPHVPSLPHELVTLIELFHPRVLRHFIPVITGWFIAYLAAVSLVRVLYDLPDNAFARRFLNRIVTGSTSGAKPVITTSSTLESQRSDSVLLRVGGPGTLIIPDGEVAVTEINGRYYRLLIPGKHKLIPFEYIYTQISLRTQERQITAVPLVTKDAINLTADLSVTYHIDRGGILPTLTQPYPFDEEAVKRAAYTRVNNGSGQATTWLDTPVNTAQGILRGIISNYNLDELLHPAGGAREPHYIISQDLKRKANRALKEIGVELESIRIGRLELPEAAAKQYIDHWQANLDAQIQLALAEGKASSWEEVEMARAEAEVAMIQAIAEGLEKARLAGSAHTMRDVIALRLIEALEKMARQSQSLEQLPQELLAQIDYIRSGISLTQQLPASHDED